MPELPEVETVRRGPLNLVKGNVIEKVTVLYPKMIENDPKEFCELLKGRKIEDVDRRGKYLLFRFSGSLTMVSHLRMEGKYFVKQASQPLEKHTHVVFDLNDGRQLRYNDMRKFGRMRLVKTGDENQLSGIAKLGPEPLSDDFTAENLYSRLKKKRKEIKPALLDQTLVTGLGNIYVDEVLWMSKIHPETPANHLSKDEARLLHDSIVKELKTAIKAGGTTIRSYTDAFQHTGSFQFDLNVYGKEGEPCPRCQTKIVKIKVGQRGTHFCPHCQKVE